VYAECSDNLGILEWESISNTLVQFFPNQTGYLSAAPADDKILVLDYDTPTVNVLQPNSALFRLFVLSELLTSASSCRRRSKNLCRCQAGLWSSTATSADTADPDGEHTVACISRHLQAHHPLPALSADIAACLTGRQRTGVDGAV